MDLFEAHASTTQPAAPLAERMRPRTLDEFVGQQHVFGERSFLRRALQSDRAPSMIIWGPPGTGKTTLAHLIARRTSAEFVPFSAVTGGVKEVREIVELARRRLGERGRRTVLFVDEIHRFNKAQQDAFLPHVERGMITLVGATTENPSFSINAALLSRCRVVALKPLGEPHLVALLRRALEDTERGMGERGALPFTDEQLLAIAHAADGDARHALNLLEQIALDQQDTDTPLDFAELLERQSLRYDRGGDNHYDVASALIKSLRGSDPDAAIYWLARMVESGEDPRFLTRRLIIFASEDVGNADPRALPLAVACAEGVDRIGLPEGRLLLAQTVTYLACASKSNRSYLAYQQAAAAVAEHGALPVPLHLRNAPSGLMKAMGHGKGYQYPHDHPGAHLKAQYLPEQLRGARFYQPSESGAEKVFRDRIKQWWGR